MSLFEQASIFVTPNAFKEGKLYTLKPEFDTSGALPVAYSLDVVRATTATRVNSAGLIESVANNIPRLDYTNGSCPSILVEPQRTNLALRSEDFSDAIWIKTQTAITANATSSPSATTTADKFIPSESNTIHQVAQNITAASGNVTISFFAKKAELSQIGAIITGGGIVGSITSAFDLNTKSFFIGTGSFSNLANDWVRISITTPTDGTDLNVRFRIYSAENPIFAGNGTDGIFLWGAQLELGSNATSYIPTVATAVTRNADVISKTGISDLIGQTEGTVFVEVDLRNIISRRLISLTDDTSNNEIRIGIDSANNLQAVCVVSGVVQCNIITTYAVGLNLIAFSYKQNDFAFYKNGILVGTSVIGNVPANSKLNIGSAFNGTAQLNDNINSVQLYKTRLSNETLSQLTTI